MTSTRLSIWEEENDVCSLHDVRFLRMFNKKMDRTRGTDQLKERERAEIHSGTVIKGSAMKNEF